MEEPLDKSTDSAEVYWTSLPHVVLSQIFQNLSCLDRICARYVCESWYHALSGSDCWKTFDFSEKDVYDSKLRLQELLNGSERTCNSSIGKDTRFVVRHIFLDIIRNFGKHFHAVTLTFDGVVSEKLLTAVCEECTSLKKIHLQAIIRGHCQEGVCSLIQRNKQLRSVRLVNIVVNSKNDPLPIGLHHSLTLKKLCLVNSFQSYNLGTLMYLVNLKELSIEPQLLSYSLLHHLAGHSLSDLYIVAISKVTGFYQEAMQDWHWKEICKQGPNFRVHFRFSSSHEWTEKEIILKPSIPAKSMIYFKHRLVHFLPLSPLIKQYFQTLEVLIDFSIDMASYKAAHSDKDINGMNNCLLEIVRQCQNLRLFSVKEVLASSTLIAMVHLNRNLKELYVMGDQVIYKNLTDTITVPEETAEVVEENWTKDKFEKTMSDIIGKPWWPLCSENYFEKIKTMCDNFV